MMKTIVQFFASVCVVSLPATVVASRPEKLSASTVLVFQMNPRHTDVKFQCSGSLIAHDLVLTAAHCLFPKGRGNRNSVSAKNVMVYFGNLRFGEKFDPHRTTYASNVAIHPGYTGRFSKNEMPNLKDLALIKLSKLTRFPYAVANVLPSTAMLRTGMSALVAGYGKSYEGQQNQDLLFHHYNGYIIENVGEHYSLVTLRGAPLQGSKEGDSGGPSFLASDGLFKQWGVFSAYDPNEGLAFYVDLRREKAWLNEAAARLGSLFSTE